MDILPSEDDNNEDTTLNLSNLDIEISKTYNLSANDFLDRFQSEESLKDSFLPRMILFILSLGLFRILACMNAFYNLLDCFVKIVLQLSSIQSDFIASNYNLLLVIENQIHSINSKEIKTSKFGIDILKLKITFLNIHFNKKKSKYD